MELLLKSRVNKIQFRFRTNKPSGIILYSSHPENFLLVELYHGNIIAKMSLGTGKNKKKCYTDI